MGPYCLDPKIACEGKEPIYDLIGVVNHMGSMVSPSFDFLQYIMVPRIFPAKGSTLNYRLVLWSLYSSSAASR